MKTLRMMSRTVIFALPLLVLNSSLMGQDEPKKVDDDAAKLTKQFESLVADLEDDLDELSDPLAAYAAEVKAQEKKVADLTKKHGADSKQAKRAVKVLAEQKANLAAATKVVEDPETESSVDPLAAYADDIKSLEKRIARLTKENGADSKTVKRATAQLVAKKQNLADLKGAIDGTTDDSLATDPAAAYAAEVKKLAAKLAAVVKKNGKDSKEAKQVAQALAAAKENQSATSDPGESPDVLIAELASRIAKCKDPKVKKELQAKLQKLEDLLPQLNLGDTESPGKK